ncbi:unnamed protein product [Urochloa humidicola]
MAILLAMHVYRAGAEATRMSAEECLELYSVLTRWGGSSLSSTPDLALELSVPVHGGGARIRSFSLLSVEGPAGVK